MEEKKKSIKTQILEHLEKGRTITALEALEKFGTLRLGARIYDLRNNGYPICGNMVQVPSGKYVKRYYLKKSD